MRAYLKYIIPFLFPVFLSAQDKKVEKSDDRLEIVGKWKSYSSMDTTKIEFVEFRPDGSFVEYKNGQPKHSEAKFVFYKDELTMKSGKSEKEPYTIKFKVEKIEGGLVLKTMNVNEVKGDKLVWVKLFTWKP